MWRTTPGGIVLAEIFITYRYRSCNLQRESAGGERGPALARGDISCLSDEIQKEILRLSHHDFFTDAGATFGIDPVRVVLACMAEEAAVESRFANRVLVRLLRGVNEDAFREVTGAWAEFLSS